MKTVYSDWRNLPNEQEAFSDFLSSYSPYRDTMGVDRVRREEYSHLDVKGQVCLDYTGVGLFSNSHKNLGSSRPGIGLSYTSVNLATHAMYTEDGTTESFFRKRILRYMNLEEKDYYIVFTANSFSAFKLLGESYPFHEAQNLLLSYDHKCENVDGISECASAKAANVLSANLSWPGLRIDAEDLRMKLQGKRKFCSQKAGNAKGLFAYPILSSLTGIKNSRRWIREAQQNGWHVLLDVTSVAGKAFDSLRLSVFLPDFIIGSFYRVFGKDPTGFGCLLIRRSVLRTLGDSSRARAIGMVKIVTKQVTYSSPSDSPVSTDLPNGSHVSCLKDDSCVSRHDPNSLHGISSQAEKEGKVLPTDNFKLHRSERDANTPSKSVYHVGYDHTGNIDVVIERNRKLFASSSWHHVDTDMRFKGMSDTDNDHAVDNYGMDIRWLASASWHYLDAASSSSGPILTFHQTPLPSNNVVLGKVCDRFSGVGRRRGEHDGSKFYDEPSTRKQHDDFCGSLSTTRLSSFSKRISHHIDVGGSGSGYGEDPEVGLLGFHSVEPSRPQNNGKPVTPRSDMQVTRRPNVKGLFYGQCIAVQTPGMAVTNLAERAKGLSNRDDTTVAESSLRRSTGFNPAEEATSIDNWSALYDDHHGSASPESLSPVSPPGSPSRYRSDVVQEKERGCAVNEDLHQSEITGVDKETEVICEGLDHADILGSNMILVRHRCLIDWLTSYLHKLRHPQPERPELVRIYGLMTPVNCAANIAFNLLDSAGKMVDPKRVQMLADRRNISVRTGIIQGSLLIESLQSEDECQDEIWKACVELAAPKWYLKEDLMHTVQLPVVYATLGLLSNFSDVYRLWVFASQFLNPEFVKQELWHYQALNQETIEI